MILRSAMAAAALLTLSACDRGPAPVSETEAVSADTPEACPFRIAKALCQDEKLSGLYGRMKAELGAAAATVSAEGKKIIADNQAAWVEAQRLSCGVEKEAPSLTAEQQTCMESALTDRLNNAAEAVQKIGPFVFQRVEINKTTPVDKNSTGVAMLGDDAPNTVTADVDYPRIDGDTPVAQKFNSLVAQAPRFKAEDNTEESVKYKIAYAGPDLISVRFDMYDNTIGTAHPNTGAKAINFNIKTLAPLKAEDVFKAGSGWEDFLAARAAASVTKTLKAMDETYPAIAPAELRAAAADPANWAITDNALVLVFSEEAMGSHAVGQQEASVPWADLKRFLSPTAPAPINKS